MDIDQTITAAYRWTAQESLTSHFSTPRLMEKKSPLGLIKWIAGLLLAAFVFINLVVIFVTYLASPDSISSREFWQELVTGWLGSSQYVFQIIGLFILVFGGFWWVTYHLSPWLQKRHVLRYFAKNPGAEIDVRVTINAEELAWGFGETTKTINKWQMYHKVVRTNNGFLFYMQNGYHWLPKHAFQSEQDILTLSEIARQKAACYEEIYPAEK